ncbi:MULTISPECIES: hypothetical protein [Anaerotignum]|uniref:hypothetical protein n=1 Tax=Anaerotignum TaxID=2039240 RepID=UPI002108B7C6|nr:MULTISPECIES: hypothetical protein [Anaerotignum]MCQ4937107.1 hypothetical protein [Anaerotignum propionicum]
MSAFLGPIHYWLYRKIQLQESLTQSMTSVLSEEKRIHLEKNLDAVCGVVERRPLEEVIDNGNIHGWLQGQIAIAEKRFAAAVTKILKEDSSKIENLKQAAYQMGQKDPLPNSNDAQGIYRGLNDVLLEGMPCDHVNQILEQSDQRVLWNQTVDLHLPFWDEAGGDIEHYYLLRNAFISGSLSDQPFKFQQLGKEFLIQEV